MSTSDDDRSTIIFIFWKLRSDNTGSTLDIYENHKYYEIIKNVNIKNIFEETIIKV